jgi:glucuronoarabinoxylan endo-1,4-beta-xylanase
VRIDPTGSPTSIPPWATTAPNTGSWFDEVTNAQEAVAANPKAIVMATPWTPPASLKSSSSSQPFFSGTCSPAAGFCGGFLEPANYATYASYLEDFVNYFDDNAGFNLYAISMQNEPDFANVDYESCNWTAAQMDTWIAGNASTLTTKLIMPESFQFIQAQSNAALEDPDAEPLISIIGGHLYGSSPTPYTLAKQDDKPLWMTEHMFTPAGSQPAIGDALQLAEEIHNSMVTGNYSAYVYWWIWDDPADSINYGLINSDTTAPAPTYYGYAIGQFSKFIQPGYVMVSATNPVLGVFDSAYMGDGNLVIVAINSNITATSFPVTIQGQAATSFTPYQTSATNTMTQLTPVSVTGGVFTYSLPAQSITTFVASASTAPGFTLSPSASNVSVTQSKTATDTISVADLNGFTGSVSLAVSGVPAGVTATLGTNPTTGSSVLTFTANSTATTGAATVTVTGTSGTLTETATISLFVGSDSCNIVYTISPQSSSAFGGAITIDNTSTTALSNWALGWTFANAQTVSQLWNGVETQSGANVTVINESYNGDIPAGGSLSQVGFNGTWNGVTNAVPTSFTLNGVTCSGGSGTGTGTGSFTLAPSENTLSVTQGSSVTDTITVTDVSPVAGSVTLSASGLPTGVTASFGTNPATGTSVVTFAASATATTGPATVTITGTSGTLTASTTIALTVASAAGSFTLASSAKTLSVTQGGNATDTITVTDISPFAGSATLAATGLPTGVTVTFSTNPAAGTSLVMFTASATATAGASTVTITATSGTLSASTTIALTVAPSTPGGCTIDYTISPQNTSAFGASITIINNASTALSSWTLTWAFPNGQTVSSLWTGVETQSGANVTVTNEPYNGSIPTGGSLTGIGFNGTWDGVTNAIPGAFSINGTACTVN